MLSLSGPEYYLIFIIMAALALIVSNTLAPDLVALLVVLALGLSGIIKLDEALAGFSRPAVITIMGLFVITSTLERTGVVQWLAERLARLSGRTEGRIMLVFMGAGSLLSLVMNNIAAGAVLLPAAVHVARQAQVPPSKVLMPLAFGTLVGGMATLFTTANIIVSSALQSQGERALTVLDFLPTGGAIVVTGTLYMWLVGRRMLPSHETLVQSIVPAAPAIDLPTTYQLDQRLWEVQILPTSPLVGQSLAQSEIGKRLGVTVLGIWHGREAKLPPSPTEVIAADDILLVLGHISRVNQLAQEGATIGRGGQYTASLSAQEVRLAEAIVGPRSPMLGQTLKDIHFRAKFGLTVVAVWRSGRSYRTDVGTLALQAGDALLLVGPAARIQVLALEPGFIVLEPPAPPPTTPNHARLSALITALAIGVSAFGWVPTPEAMLAGAVLMALTGCIRMENVYRAIEWRIIFLIAGMSSLTVALVSTGLAERIGQGLAAALLPFGPLALIAGLYLFTVLLTQVVGGQVSALIVGPVAIAVAVQAQVNPPAVAVAVAIACSTSFLTPLAHPVNMLMINPGGYTFGDFIRVGSGMTLTCLLTLLLSMPLLWSL